MSIIYVPRLIESAEQAEALPEDTVAIEPDTFFCQKIGANEWASSGIDGTCPDAAMIGWTALVPIEADKVRSENRGGFFVTERHAADPFAAYYVHGEEA